MKKCGDRAQHCGRIVAFCDVGISSVWEYQEVGAWCGHIEMSEGG